jgi:hypothetical protein
MEQQQANFSGWARVELLGHQSETGYVTTVYFGGAALFKVDVPEVPEKERISDHPGWLEGKLCPTGTKVTFAAVPGYTRFISPAALYALNPCSEEVARKVIERVQGEVKVVELPASQQLTTSPEPTEEDEQEEDYDDAELDELEEEPEPYGFQRTEP